MDIFIDETHGNALQNVTSSSDDENVNPDTDSTIGVKYQALKRQLKHIYSERDTLQHKVHVKAAVSHRSIFYLVINFLVMMIL